VITLVEKYRCETKDELHARERYYIENNKCVNKVIPTRTTKEYNDSENGKEAKKRYRQSEHGKAKEKAYQMDYQQKLYFCDVCNSECLLQGKSRHFKSINHLKNVEKVKVNF